MLCFLPNPIPPHKIVSSHCESVKRQRQIHPHGLGIGGRAGAALVEGKVVVILGARASGPPSHLRITRLRQRPITPLPLDARVFALPRLGARVSAPPRLVERGGI